MEEKKCTSCLEIKPLDQFSQQERGLYGRRSRCKLCVCKYNHQYIKKRWSEDEEFRERTKKKATEWAKKNPEKRAAIAKKRNKKAISENPEKVKARALVNQRVRFKRIPRASELKCCNCGAPAKQYHHHKGYDWDNRYNVVPVCIPCHNILDLLWSKKIPAEVCFTIPKERRGPAGLLGEVRR